MGRHQLIPAVYLALIRNNKILLLRRFNTGYEDGNYMTVAGHLEPNESFIEAMVREAKEEADIDIKEADLEIVHVLERPSLSRLDIYLTASAYSGEAKNLEPDKCDQLEWFDIDHLPDNTIPCVRQAINCIKDDILHSIFE